jgi:vacuolar-type H+-ATPase subunit F/Vma7
MDWNGTCGVTQMPIRYGDRVVLVFLLENKFKDHGGSGFCYSDNQYYPITIPIFGEYNDYGAIENIGRKNKSIVFNHLIELIDNKKLIIKQDEEKREKPEDYEELFDIIHDGNLIGSDGVALGFMLIHENVYKMLVEEMYNRQSNYKYWNYGTELKYFAEKYLEKAKEEMQQYKNKINNPIFVKVCDEDYDYDYDDAFTMQFSGFRKIFLRHYMRVLRKTQSKSLMESLVYFSLFIDAMEFGRKMWTPQCGAGSQSEDYGIHQTIAKCIDEQIKRVRREYKNDNNDCTDEEIENCIKDYLF